MNITQNCQKLFEDIWREDLNLLPELTMMKFYELKSAINNDVFKKLQKILERLILQNLQKINQLICRI